MRQERRKGEQSPAQTMLQQCNNRDETHPSGYGVHVITCIGMAVTDGNHDYDFGHLDRD